MTSKFSPRLREELKTHKPGTLYDAVIHIPQKRSEPATAAEMKLKFNSDVAEFSMWLHSLPEYWDTLEITGETWISSSLSVRANAEVLEKIAARDVVVYVDLNATAPMHEIQDR
jgi:hypothetical protein